MTDDPIETVRQGLHAAGPRLVEGMAILERAEGDAAAELEAARIIADAATGAWGRAGIRAPDHAETALIEAVKRAAAVLPADADPAAIAEAMAMPVYRNMRAAARLAAEATAETPQPAQPLDRWQGLAEPEAVIWRHDGADRWPLCSIGEPAILSGAGGTGKSYAALALAIAAAQASWKGGEADALGFGVRRGPVLICAYEDSPRRLAGRVARVAGGASNAPWMRLHILPAPGPLFRSRGAGAGIEPTGTWQALIEAVQTVKPSLVILDPAGELIDGADANQPGPARAFMRALAAASEEHGFGALIAAHDTKAHRNETRAGERPGAGAVAGSAAWADRARGVAYMAVTADGGRTIEIIKANHGRTGWGVTLAARMTRYDGFAGWQAVRTWADATTRDTPPGDGEIPRGEEGLA